jgi:anti-sigma factor RsiW
MACAEFEDRLLEYAVLPEAERRSVDAHVAGCAGCREFLDALASVDRELTAHFSGREVSANFNQAVTARVRRETAHRRPSLVPEVLDFVGWGAIVTLIALFIYWLTPQMAAASGNAIWISASVFLMAGILVALRSFADLKH